MAASIEVNHCIAYFLVIINKLGLNWVLQNKISLSFELIIC